MLLTSSFHQLLLCVCALTLRITTNRYADDGMVVQEAVRFDSCETQGFETTDVQRGLVHAGTHPLSSLLSERLHVLGIAVLNA